MKWFLFLAGSAAVYPLGRFLRGRPHLEPHVWTVVGLLPFLGPMDIGLVSEDTFPGDSHGIEVAAIDLIVLALIVARPHSDSRVPRRALLFAYLLATALSVSQAAQPLPALFYLWKLLRMYMLVFAVVRAATSTRVPLAILRGMAIGVFYEFFLVMEQRFTSYQSQGSFAHQNSLGMTVNLVLMPMIAVVLARGTTWLLALAPLAGVVVVILTRSRGALLYFVLGLTLVYLLSLLRGATRRKVAVAVIGGLVVFGLVTKSAQRIIDRFQSAPAASMETREQFKDAALMMLRDHPLGVGANHFTWYMVNAGYASRAGLEGVNQSAIVHNVYWLTAVELGPLGLLALVALFVGPLVDVTRSALVVRRNDLRGDLLVGLGVGLLGCYVHSAVEWIWRATEVSYVYWMTAALAGALAAQVRRQVLAQEGRGARSVLKTRHADHMVEQHRRASELVDDARPRLGNRGPS